MPGLFDSFDNLDRISAEALASWLKPVPQLTQIENYLANKILYPQALPVSRLEMQLDLAILREALRANGPQGSSQKINALLGDNPFLNITLRKILIPRRFLEFVPDLKSLVWVFVDALLLNRRREDWFQDLWTVVLTGETDEIVGSVILPQFEKGKGLMKINVQGKSYGVQAGGLMVIPCPGLRCEIVYRIQDGRVLDKTDMAMEVYGGKLGLMIDGRR